MSKTTKRKHVTQEALTEYYVPEGEEEIVKVVGSRGNNLHEVESADGKKFLVSMPTKFRRNLWIKRGNFVVINPIKEGNKVIAEIVYILYAKQIRYLQVENLWPESFKDKDMDDVIADHVRQPERSESSSDECDCNDWLPKNPNRIQFDHVDDTGSSSSEEEINDCREVPKKPVTEEDALEDSCRCIQLSD